MFFHILRHVDSDQGLFVVKQKLGQCARRLGFADAGGAHKDKRAERAIGIGHPGAGPTNRVGNRQNRLALPDNALLNPLLHMGQFFSLPFNDPGHRNPGPFGDNFGDILRVDFFF